MGGCYRHSPVLTTMDELASQAWGDPPGAGAASHQKWGWGSFVFSSGCEMYGPWVLTPNKEKGLPVPRVSVYKVGFIFVHVVLFVSAHQIPSTP